MQVPDSDAFAQIGGKRIVARIDPETQTRTEIGDVPVDHALNPPWVHDLPASANYILVPDTPIVMDYGLKVITLSEHVQTCKCRLLSIDMMTTTSALL